MQTLTFNSFLKRLRTFRSVKDNMLSLVTASLPTNLFTYSRVTNKRVGALTKFFRPPGINQDPRLLIFGVHYSILVFLSNRNILETHLYGMRYFDI